MFARTTIAIVSLFAAVLSIRVAEASPETRSIDSTVAKIDGTLKHLQEHKQPVETGTDRGGEMTVYQDGSVILRIDVNIGLSNADVIQMFYYSRDELIFVREEKLMFPYLREPGIFDLKRPKQVAETRYYKVRDRLVAKSTRGSNNESLPSTTLMKESAYLLHAIENREVAISLEKLLK